MRSPLLSSIFLSALVSASSFAAGGFEVGGGMNASRTTQNYGNVNYSPRIGINMGAGYEAELKPVLFLLPEINLETRGEVAEGTGAFAGVTSHLNLFYLQMPLFLMTKIPTQAFTLDFFAGPEWGILLAGNTMTEFGGESNTSDFRDNLKPLDFGVEFGGGMEIPVGPGTAFFRPSLYLGIRDVDHSDNKPLRNLNVKLRFGYLFAL